MLSCHGRRGATAKVRFALGTPRCGILAVWLILLATGGSHPATALSPDVAGIVQRYVRARHSVNMKGMLLSVQPTADSVRTSSRRVIRRSDGRSLSLFAFPASDKGGFIADDGTWLTRYDPRDRTVRRKRSFLKYDIAATERHARLILRNYNVHLDPDETVAGRACYSLRLEPSRPRNLTVRLWVDKITGAELRREEQDGAGNTISVSIYTSVAFPRTISASEVRPPSPKSARSVNISRSEVMTSLATLSKVAGFTIRTPLALPSGYEYDRGTVVEIGGKRSGFLRYIDGLSEMTVIETRLTSGASPGLRAARVIPRPYGEVEVDYAIDDLQVVIVGRGDARELIAVAETMGKKRQEAWRTAMERTFSGKGAIVSAMRQRGLGAEAIVALLTIAEGSGRPPGDLLATYVNGGCWRALARRWRVPETEIQRRLRLVVNGR